MKKIVFAILAIVFTGLAIYLALEVIPNINTNQYLFLGIGVLSLLIAAIMVFSFFSNGCRRILRGCSGRGGKIPACHMQKIKCVVAIMGRVWLRYTTGH